MPTILELFRGSNKDITPTILDLTPVQELFAGSTQEKSVKSDQTNLIEQELSGIRIKSKVELNNPLIYGNEAIRITNRSTPSIEKMKQATGGSAADGGLIGKALGALTAGGFGKFVFGGKVTSLNQARDSVNSRLGIPQNAIPTYVYNTGGLQSGIEPDTMITLSKIKNDAAGTLVGKFLKQTGGGNPKTIGKQILGQGISLAKDKLRTALFGNPNTLGANTTGATDKYEYSSKLGYEDKYKSYVDKKSRESNLKIPGKESTDTLKKDTVEIGKAKEKLGIFAASIKDKLKGTESKPEIDKVVESKTKITTTEKIYTQRIDVESLEGRGPIGDKSIDLSLVSPVYGIDRRKTKGVFGTSPNAFKDIKNNTGAVMPNDPTRPYSGVAGEQKISTIETNYGITSNKGDLINNDYGVKGKGNGDDKDLVTFSIAGITDKQKVYFRTLITSLSETVSPTWDSAKFVGNPYSYYTYGGVERTLSLQLKMYCMNSAELSTMWQRIQFLTSKAYPSISKSNLVNPPFIEFTLGNMYQKKTAFINSLSYTFPDDGVWEIVNGNQLPKIVEVQMEFKFVENVGAEHKLYGTPISKEAVKIINKRKAEQSGTTTTVSQEPKTGGATPTTNNGGTAPQAVQAASPPPPINSVGVPQTEPPKTQSTSGGMLGVDSTPKSLDTGKPTETPKESNDGASLAAIVTTTETSYEEKAIKAHEKYASAGYPLNIVKEFAGLVGVGVTISNIKKIDETAIYAEIQYPNSKLHERVYNAAGKGESVPYTKWVADNNGKDPLNKFFSKEQMDKISTANPPKTGLPF